MCGTPAEAFPGKLAGSRTVEARETREPAKMFRRFGFNRKFQTFTNGFGDILERDSLFSHPVIPVPRGTLLQREPKKNCRVQPVYGGPAVFSLADISRNAFFPRHINQKRNETMIPFAVDRRRKPHHGSFHTFRRQFIRDLFRNPGPRGVWRRDDIFRRQCAGRNQRGARGNNKRFVDAAEDRTHGLDGSLVYLAVFFDFGEVVDEAEMDDAIRGGRPVLQTFQIPQIAPLNLGPRFGKRLGRGFGAGQAEHLVAGFDEFLNGDGADKTRGACDENFHIQLLFLIETLNPVTLFVTGIPYLRKPSSRIDAYDLSLANDFKKRSGPFQVVL